jgi:hypothetical protein
VAALLVDIPAVDSPVEHLYKTGTLAGVKVGFSARVYPAHITVRFVKNI